MTTQLAPTPVFKAFDNNGFPLANGMLYSYIAGTSTPQATYTDSTGSTPNTNPVVLNARGEANVWLNPTQGYKLVLTDSLGNQIWAVDGIIGPVNVNQSLIPAADNTYSLGSPTAAWAQLYLGANHAPVLNGGIIGYWPQTAPESAAGVTPTNYAYQPLDVRRYGADPTGAASSSAAITAACAVAAVMVPPPGTYSYGSVAVKLPAAGMPAIYQITTPVVIPSGVVLEGVGGIVTVAQAAGQTGIVLDTQVYSSGADPHLNGGVRNLYIYGTAAANAENIGLRLNNAQNFIVEHVRFLNLGGPALQVNGRWNGTNAGAFFTGTTSGTALTVLSVEWGTIAVGQTIGLTTSGGAAITIASGSGTAWTLSAAPASNVTDAHLNTFNAGLAQAITCTAYDVRALQCALSATASGGRVPSFDIGGTDHEFLSCETYSDATGGPTYQSRNRPGWYLRDVSGASFVRCRGDLHDVGWYVSIAAGLCRFTACLTLSSWAEGLIDYGYRNTWDVMVDSPSQNASGNFDGIVTYGPSNSFVSGRVSNVQVPATVPAFAITDQNVSTSQPTYIGPNFRAEAYTLADGPLNSSGATCWDQLDGSPQALAVNSATPSVIPTAGAAATPGRTWKTGNTAATRITNFLGGFPHQVIRVQVLDAFTTFANGTFMVNKTGADVAGVNGCIYEFELGDNGLWVLLNP